MLEYMAICSSNLHGCSMGGLEIRAALVRQHSNGMLLVMTEHRSPVAQLKCPAALDREELSLAAANILLSLLHNDARPCASSAPPSSGMSLLNSPPSTPLPPLSPRLAQHGDEQADPMPLPADVLMDTSADRGPVVSVWDSRAGCPVEVLRADLAAFLERQPWCVEMTEETFLIL